MKKSLKLIPAIVMLLVSAILVSTTTFAWFSMNTTVTAQGMSVQAKSEAGLSIANATDGTYDATANSVKTTAAQMYPGSTWNLTDWLHSVSTNPGSANTQQTYTAGSQWTANSAGNYGNYIVHDFYIRSSSVETLTVTSLNITGVTATVGGGASSQELSKALRVGILVDGDTWDHDDNGETPAIPHAYIYAPVSGYTTPVTIQPSPGAYTPSGRQSILAKAGNTATNITTITSIPGNSATGLHVQVFVWYEGEDASCISNNIIAGLEQLDVTVTFGYT